MIKSFCIMLLLFWMGQAKPQVHNFTINGQNRQYLLHLPDSLPGNAPLVFVLHGYSGSAGSIKNFSGMDQIAYENQFAVCYPQGLTDQWNNRFWNVGYDFHNNQTVDDVEFLTALAHYLQDEFNLSSQHTYCTGMSNGGDMCYLLACQAPDVFGAVAPVAGCLMKWIHDSCNPALPIPVFEIHGTDDDITCWNGDMNNEQGYGAYLAVPTTFQFWAQLNNCTESIVDILPDVDKSDGSMVISQKYVNGIHKNEVWLYKIVNGGHDWPGNWGNMDIHASEEIWNFFEIMQSNATNILTENENLFPENVVLHQNYPNPFNPVTTISYELQEQVQVKLAIFDILGRKGIELVNTIQSPGFKSVEWDGTDNLGQPVCAGVYFYKIEVGQMVQIRKMVLLR